MKKYKEAPWWWYIILLVLSFIAGLCAWHRFLDLSNSTPIQCRLDCRLEGTDNTPLLVVYRRFGPRNVGYGEIIL
jgi:hypothetical protein